MLGLQLLVDETLASLDPTNPAATWAIVSVDLSFILFHLLYFAFHNCCFFYDFLIIVFTMISFKDILMTFVFTIGFCDNFR